jgi:hypothetical protein
MCLCKITGKFAGRSSHSSFGSFIDVFLMCRYRSAGNGNSNARALVGILHKSNNITELNLANTGQ